MEFVFIFCIWVAFNVFRSKIMFNLASNWFTMSTVLLYMEARCQSSSYSKNQTSVCFILELLLLPFVLAISYRYEWMNNEWIYLMEKPQDKKGHKTTYTCPHSEHYVIVLTLSLFSNFKTLHSLINLLKCNFLH